MFQKEYKSKRGAIYFHEDYVKVFFGCKSSNKDYVGSYCYSYSEIDGLMNEEIIDKAWNEYVEGLDSQWEIGGTFYNLEQQLNS